VYCLSLPCVLQATDYHYFGPLSAYLAVNYLDRYLSTNQIPVSSTNVRNLFILFLVSLYMSEMSDRHMSVRESLPLPLDFDGTQILCEFLAGVG
jgi:hypothetical protein